MAALRLRPVPILLAAVLFSIALRFGGAWLKTQPLLFPDEYIYTELARGLFSGLTVRESTLSFTAVLQPLLVSPVWAVFEPELAYRVVQGLNAVLMSLAALPVYALSRRLGISPWWALGAAVVTLLIPEFVYIGFTSTEALAYPVVTAAVWAGTRALAGDGTRWSALLVLFSALAVLTRTQLIVVPAAFLVAALALALLERDVKGTLRRLALPLGVFVAVALGAAVWKGASALGGYAGVVDWRPAPASVLSWVGKDLYILAWGTGLVLLPACLVAVSYALARPRQRAERAFAVFFWPLAVFLLLQGAYYATLPDVPVELQTVHARYFFYLAPLVFVGFALFLSYSFPWPSAFAVLLLGLIGAAHYLPLSKLAGDGAAHSPFLMAIRHLDHLLGGPFVSRPYVFLFVLLTALSLILVVNRRPPLVGPTALSVASLVLVFTSTFATLKLVESSAAVEKQVFGDASIDWLERVPDGSILVVPRLTERLMVEVPTYWKPSLRPALLLEAQPPDAFSFAHVTVSPRGELLVDGEEAEGTVVFLSQAAEIRLQDGKPADYSLPDLTVVEDIAEKRLALLVEGYYDDIGWYASGGFITLWPQESRLAGYLHLEVRPRSVQETTLLLEGPGVRRTIELSAEETTRVKLPVCAEGEWRLGFLVKGPEYDFFDGAVVKEGRELSFPGPLPRFVEDRDACP